MSVIRLSKRRLLFVASSPQAPFPWQAAPAAHVRLGEWDEDDSAQLLFVRTGTREIAVVAVVELHKS